MVATLQNGNHLIKWQLLNLLVIWLDQFIKWFEHFVKWVNFTNWTVHVYVHEHVLINQFFHNINAVN